MPPPLSDEDRASILEESRQRLAAVSAATGLMTGDEIISYGDVRIFSGTDLIDQVSEALPGQL